MDRLPDFSGKNSLFLLIAQAHAIETAALAVFAATLHFVPALGY
jgi:hypothetical protein